MSVQNLNACYAHRRKLESPFLKIFRYWRIHTQNKANPCLMNFPSSSNTRVFGVLSLVKTSSSDTLTLIKQNTIKHQGISFHKRMIGLDFLLFERTTIWQLKSLDLIPLEKVHGGEENQHGHRDLPFIVSVQEKGRVVGKVICVLHITWRLEQKALPVWLPPGARHSFTQRITPETA